MSFTKIYTACIDGPRVVPVCIEIDIQPGLPQFSIIGLPDKQIDEAKERVKTAMRNCGFGFPSGKIMVNLSPSYLPKKGTHFDFAIAIGIMQASKSIPKFKDKDWLIGELSLDGKLRSCRYILAILIEAVKRKINRVIIPSADRLMANLIHECPMLVADHLIPYVQYCKDGELMRGVEEVRTNQEISSPSCIDRTYLFDAVYGQERAKRALLISLAGKHNLYFAGPPGTGKSMLVQSARELLPDLTRKELLEVVQLYAFAGETFDMINGRPPYRSPHHGSTVAGLLGGGISAKPGELSLAHKGILFLDEFPEFSRETKECLRQPLQEKMIRLVRRSQEYIYPADCLIMAARNNCPCGMSGISGQYCTCSQAELMRYEKSVSAPLLDRFDMYCEVVKIDIEQYIGKKNGGYLSAEKAKSIIEEVRSFKEAEVRSLQEVGGYLKDARDPKEQLSEGIKNYLTKAGEKLYLSGRSIEKIINVAKTISLVDKCKQVELEHIQEAISYRRRSNIVL